MGNSFFIYSIIKGLVLNTSFAVAFIMMFRNNFRIAVKWVVVIICVFFIVDVIASCFPYIAGMEEFSQISDFFITILFYIPVFCLIKDNWVNCQIQVAVYAWLYNLLGISLIGIAMIVSGWISGKLNWYVISEGSTAMKLTELSSMVFAYIVSYYIVQKLSPVILSLQGFSKIVISAFVVAGYLLIFIIKPLAVDVIVYRNNPEGIGLIIDTIQLILAITAISYIVAVYIRKTMRNRRLVRQSIDEYADNYSQVVKLKDEIRELNHELANISGADDGEVM